MHKKILCQKMIFFARVKKLATFLTETVIYSLLLLTETQIESKQYA